MNKIFITGGAGFIGSHVCEVIFKKFRKSKILIYDKITYASSIYNLKKIIRSKRVKFIKADINDEKTLLKHSKNSDLLIHLAAESHVGRSFSSTKKFINTNVQGTRSILDACRVNKIKKIIHVSTDEIYGEIYKGSFSESDPFNPSNPYSSSKAAAEMIVNGYKHSFQMDINIVRANNIFGTRQHPEKLIARACVCLINNKKIPIHGSGKQKRTFLYVLDFANALVKIIKYGKKNETYNIGSNFEYRNIDVIKLIAKELNKNYLKVINYIPDRPFNDFRYSIKINKIKKLHWAPKTRIENKITEIVNWYKKHYNKFKNSNMFQNFK